MRIKTLMVALLGALAAPFERLPRLRGCVALPNELALFNEHGIETLVVDPTESFPVAAKYLLYMRGSAYNYAKLCDGAHLPLGNSPDSPYQAGDFVAVRRLGATKGSTIGVPTAVAIALDDLVVAAAGGKVASLAAQGNGTYWVVGRCAKASGATATEMAYYPCTPYEVTVSNGGGTYAFVVPQA